MSGQPILGPFGKDTYWDKIAWHRRGGWVPDEWVNTKWDVTKFLPSC